MMGFGFIWILVIIGVIALVLGWRPGGRLNSQPTRQPQATALDILKERYARGEIGRDEFEAMRKDLTS